MTDKIPYETRQSANPDDHGEVIICLGPPWCELLMEDAIENQLAGCPMCRRVVCWPDGSSTEYKLKAN